MKSTIITLILAFAALAGFAQNKPKADSVKAQYEKVVIVPIADYQSLINFVSGYRNLTTYGPNGNPGDKLNEQAAVDQYLMNLPKRIRIDSVKTTKKQ